MALVHDRMTAEGVPPFLYTHLQKETAEKIQKKLDESNTHMCTVLLKKLQAIDVPMLPSIDDLLASRVMIGSPPWSAHCITKPHPLQPKESFMEQQHAIKLGVKAIDDYMSLTNECPKSLIIVGDPGAGKTTVQQFLLLHAISNGLNCWVTAQMSQRALELGGTHVHEWLCLPVREGCSSAHMAELAIS